MTKQISRIRAISFCLLFSLAAPAFAQGANEQETIDEITVVGEARLDDLRFKLFSAETDVYDIFNDLNDEDEFDVLCAQESPTGSHIKQRFCEPRFMEKLYSEAFRDGRGDRISKSKLKRKQEEMAVIMEALANESDDLLNALVVYAEAAERYYRQIDEDCTGNETYCGG